MDNNTNRYQKSMDDISNIVNFYKEYAAKRQSDKRRHVEDVSEDISIAEWKKALRYDEYESTLLLSKLLDEFGIPMTEKNKKILKNSISNLISIYEKNYDVVLEPIMLLMLGNLAAKIVLDRLAVKHLV